MTATRTDRRARGRRGPAMGLAAGLAALLLAGCGAGLDRAPGERDVAIAVDSTRQTAPVTTDGARAVAEAEAFLARSGGVGAADRLYVLGAPAAEREALAAALDAPGRAVKALPGGGPLRLLLVRAVAIPPACSDWSEPPAHDFSNLPPRNYGCATQSNLARMVADPNDLISGRGGGPADSQAATVGVSAYRLGNITWEEDDVSFATQGEE